MVTAALTTLEVQERLAALKALLQDVGPTIAKCLTKLVLSSSNKKPTPAEALKFLAAELVAVVSELRDRFERN